MPMMQNQRVSKLKLQSTAVTAAVINWSLQISLLADNYSLYFNKTKSSDTGVYSCIINDRHSPESIIDLLIQGK